MTPLFEIIFLFIILAFGLIGTSFIGYVMYKYETTTDMKYMDMMFFSGIFSFIPVGALAFSIIMLIDKL